MAKTSENIKIAAQNKKHYPDYFVDETYEAGIDFKNYYEQIGIAVMLSVIGFTITGISNDSSVTVSPIFWAITGLGVYVNAQVKKSRKKLSERK